MYSKFTLWLLVAAFFEDSIFPWNEFIWIIVAIKTQKRSQNHSIPSKMFWIFFPKTDERKTKIIKTNNIFSRSYFNFYIDAWYTARRAQKIIIKTILFLSTKTFLLTSRHLDNTIQNNKILSCDLTSGLYLHYTEQHSSRKTT